MSVQSSALPRERNSLISPAERTRMIRALVDELIPGAEGWPSASDAGVHGILAMRVFTEWSAGQMTSLADLLGWETEGLSSPYPETRIVAVKAFEAANPDLFDKIYTATTIAYYETPFVIEAIQATGRPYSYRPHATGYPMAQFDFDRDRPKHQRGHFVKTDEVIPLDPSPLNLDTVKTVKWGLDR